MTDIWVNLNDLYQLIRQMRKDNIGVVHLVLNDPDEFDGDVIPGSLSLSGIKSSDPNMEIDYTDDEPLTALDIPSPSSGCSVSLQDIFE